jgi:hypothetical protein
VTPVIIQPRDIWTAAGVLLGFQVTSFIWRIDREVKMGAAGEQTWLVPSDFVNIISMIVTVVGVFVLPILGVANATFLKYALGLAALLFIGHAFARAGHYGLYSYPLRVLRYTLAEKLGKTGEDLLKYNPNRSEELEESEEEESEESYQVYFPREEQVVVGIIFTVAFAYVIVATIQG